MSAPERIWAARSKSTDATMWWPDEHGGGTEYIRKDIAEARIVELEVALSAIASLSKIQIVRFGRDIALGSLNRESE